MSSSEIGIKVIGTATEPDDGTVVRDDLPPIFTAYFGQFLGGDYQVFREIKPVTNPGASVLTFAPQFSHMALRIITPGTSGLLGWKVDAAIAPAPPDIHQNWQNMESGDWLIITNTYSDGISQAGLTTTDTLDLEVISFGSTR